MQWPYLDHLRNVAASLLENGDDIVAAGLCLGANVALHHVTIFVGVDLTRDEDVGACYDGLRLSCHSQLSRLVQGRHAK